MKTRAIGIAVMATLAAVLLITISSNTTTESSDLSDPVYKCYEISGNPRLNLYILENQFGTEVVNLGLGATRLCPPAAIDDDVIGVAGPPVKCYDITGQSEPPGPPDVPPLRLETQWGVEEDVVVGQPKMVCAPGRYVPGFPIPPFPPLPLEPFYKCYEIDGASPGVILTSLKTDEFGVEENVTVGRAALLCLPTIVEGRGSLLAEHLKCYEISGPSVNETVTIETFFGLEEGVPVGVPELVCVKVQKTVPTPTPAPTPTPPVGGITELLVGDSEATSQASGSSSDYVVIVAAIAAAGALIALAAGGWHARRRRMQ